MSNLFSSQETLVNLTADEVEWRRTLNSSSRAGNTDAAELVDADENGLTLRQRILRLTRAVKRSAKHQLQSAKHGLVRVVRQVSEIIADSHVRY
ncbi:hypothetical protein QCA50_018551 [Cerrena zonata]|uniref:Uncharacterized protein n=1 Tax=Cerrena zonata TaxID=2478898 RepID=A0AAW0FP84_9APHY